MNRDPGGTVARTGRRTDARRRSSGMAGDQAAARVERPTWDARKMFPPRRPPGTAKSVSVLSTRSGLFTPSVAMPEAVRPHRPSPPPPLDPDAPIPDDPGPLLPDAPDLPPAPHEPSPYTEPAPGSPQPEPEPV